MGILTSREIGERVREFRKRRGLTQEQLAEIVSVTFQQIQKYENGFNRMNTDKLQAIAQALSVPASSFFDDDKGEERLLSEQERKLVNGFRSIPSSEVREFLVEHLLKSP
ncbi:MAG: hypothetical protein A2076_07075 [Geobacteraceae bacterium GWC2_53_11]|nr:MAG: hypothetical protein A2076_07075 [Geobacteraceae bacterium GWC2_53_11]